MSAGEILDNLSHLPDGIDHPAAAGIAVAASVAAIGGTYLHHRFAQAKRVEAFGGNHELAEQAVIDVRGSRETPVSRARRLAPVIGLIAGAGLAAAGYFGHPTYETSHSDSAASEMVVVDSSNAMIYTEMDQGSRYQAAISGLTSDRSYSGRLGVIVTGADNATGIPIGRDWRQSLEDLKDPQVNPNGSELASAINAAGQQLPRVIAKDGTQKSVGQVVIVSDGASSINSSSPTSISTAITSLRQAGASVRVIVPGTADGTYKLDGQTYGSAAQPQLFGGATSVEQAASASEVASDIRESIASTSTIHEQEPWQLPLDLGLLAMAGSAVWMGERTIRRN